MKVRYIFYNPVIGHHHLHNVDNINNEIAAPVDVYDVKGQKPYTIAQAINFASQQPEKLEARRKDIAIAKSIEAITVAVKEVTPDQQERDKLTSELIAAMEKTKVTVATAVDEKIVEAGVK